ncbi:unnamed protein product, partial [Ixodes hexagonus]
EFQPISVFTPELYANAHAPQRTAGIAALESLERSRQDAQVLDVGCGTGDFTYQQLLTRCQPCRRIVATDVSQSMVRYAKEHFGHPLISYEVHAIEDDISALLNTYGKFDRVYSFSALHWVKNLKAALRNIAGFMTDDGDALLIFIGRWAGYDAWRKIVQMDRWRPYKEICESFIPKTHDFKDHAALKSYMRDVLKSAGLKAQKCQVVTARRNIEHLDQTIETHIALIPILPLLPEGLGSDLKADLADVLRSMLGDDGGHTKFSRDDFIIHATKETETDDPW